ncbi:CDPK-related kinase 4 [Hibiscus syriacus]|uniref:non-specific serine/threonine protein kinase n=1 Tax=Hibiscus syriacus TaxID=106335 RepID=A0A6A2YQX6_HIBSY|nr:CDPK-related kinase 4 [Hibiscus syriacus]
MGQCYGKVNQSGGNEGTTTTVVVSADRDETSVQSANGAANVPSVKNTPARSSSQSPWPSPYPHGVSASPLPSGVSPSPARTSRGSTPRRLFRRPFPPPSPAKHIKASLVKRFGGKPKEGPIPEDRGTEPEQALDKNFGYGKNFGAKYELGKEVGRGHFGHTCSARGKKGELKDQPLAVKIISKAKMTTAISIEDVRREVKILKALSGHKHLVQFYDACEDANNVYIVMELCEGGELLDRILARGGRYTEEDAKAIVVQILSVASFCHLQGVVHRDLKPENFLFTSGSEDADMKLIDFGLSDFIRPDERLNDIVGSAYYVAPEVLHRSYSLEADIWSIGVITYILLCGSRPFWARSESGIFRSVLRSDPNFDDLPWPSVSPEAKDFVKRLLNKDYRKRMTAVQALTHPWLRDDSRLVPLDILIYKSVKSYLHATPFKRAAQKALSKALTEDELVYLRAQFTLLEPNRDGSVSLENFKMALARNATDAMGESRVTDILNNLGTLAYRKMYFEEFCAAAISTHQLEAVEGWEQIASSAFEHFEQDGNRVISIEELARELNVGPSAYSFLKDWIRTSDGKLSLLGYTKFLHDTVPKLSLSLSLSLDTKLDLSLSGRLFRVQQPAAPFLLCRSQENSPSRGFCNLCILYLFGSVQRVSNGSGGFHVDERSTETVCSSPSCYHCELISVLNPVSRGLWINAFANTAVLLQ